MHTENASFAAAPIQQRRHTHTHVRDCEGIKLVEIELKRTWMRVHSGTNHTQTLRTPLWSANLLLQRWGHVAADSHQFRLMRTFAQEPGQT